MSTPRKHHFVPAFYLAHWADDGGEIIEWSVPYRVVEPKKRHPNATGFQKDLYSFPGLRPEAREWIEEEFMKRLDDRAAQIMKKMVVMVPMNSSDSSRSDWSRFLMTLRFRHPDCIFELREAIASLWESHDSFTKVPYQKYKKENDPETFSEYLKLKSPDGEVRAQVDMLVTCMDNEILGTHIANLPWAVINLAASGLELLTSDWPVNFFKDEAASVILVPISPTLLFVASENLDFWIKKGSKDSRRLVKLINLFVVGRARRYVFSSNEKQGNFIRKNFGTDRVSPPFYPSLKPVIDELLSGK